MQLTKLMKIKYKILTLKISILFALLLYFLPANAQNPADFRTDSTKVKVRYADDLEKYRNDRDFIYEENVRKPVSFFDRLLDWIDRILEAIFDSKGIAPYIRNAIIIIILILIIIKLVGVKYQTLFTRHKKGKGLVDLEVYEDDINNLDLEKLISDYIKNNEYNRAVRYLYLKLLKLMSENEIISWTKEKTNREYREEADKTSFGPAFAEHTYLYEHIWYGDFEINKSTFEKTQNKFHETFLKLT